MRKYSAEIPFPAVENDSTQATPHVFVFLGDEEQGEG
jgi:hypothetical protein